MTAAARPLPRLAPAAVPRGAWAESFGERWWVDVTVMALLAFGFGAVRPLADPDLPMHLAVGEWIVAHHAVPYVEPFAWTRAGAPYFAYSWLPQALFYLVLAHAGPAGLRALQGLVVVATGAAGVALARAAGWRPGQAIILASLNVVVGELCVALLRPQSILLVTLPLVWAAMFAVSDGRRVAAACAALCAASALTANWHLFFPLTLAPAALLWARPPARRAHAAAALGSVLAGWLASPYAAAWPRVFRHNFAPNILMRPPSAITELQPGFVAMLQPPPSLLALVAGMLLVPWALAGAPLRARERVMAALCWTAGLVAFGYAARLFVAWWLLAIVPAGWAVAHLTRHTPEGAPRLRFRVLGLAACLAMVAAEARRTAALRPLEGTTATRTLPTVGAAPAARLAAWLERATRHGAHGRVMTAFAYGSYLTWRLPRYSASIDSRGIFPDSVAAAEAVVGAADRDVPLGPWASADVAVLPLRFRAAAALDTAAAWRRVATAADPDERADSAGLWVRRAWWAAWARP